MLHYLKPDLACRLSAHSIFIWRAAHEPFESAAEVLRILVAQAVSYLTHRLVGLHKQVFSHIHRLSLNVVDG